jgi:hypothetical protein
VSVSGSRLAAVRTPVAALRLCLSLSSPVDFPLAILRVFNIAHRQGNAARSTMPQHHNM